MGRLGLVLVLGVSTGCASLECGVGTHEEDGFCVRGDPDRSAVDEVPIDPGEHPNVPPEFQGVWNTEDPCSPQGGGSGNQVYVMGEVRVEEDGTLTGEERWYWFWSAPGWEDDCIDTFTLTGTPAAGADTYGCVQCDETYEVARKLTDAECDMSYRQIMNGRDEDQTEVYNYVFLFDTISPMGNQNEKMLVMTYVESSGWGGGIDNDYARGNIYPDTEIIGPPADYDWIGERCQRGG